MDLSDLLKLSADQDAGHTFTLTHPVSGDPLDIKIKIAGPDSDRQRKARFEMEREIARLSTRKGGSTPEQREQLNLDSLFACCLGWEINEGGKPVPFTAENFARACRAATWLRAQIDVFANDRTPYFGKGA